MVSRNDNYGGKLIHRMQASIDSILKLSEKYELDAELIIVEWNPPEDEKRLSDALDFSSSSEHTEVRIIEVPTEVHNSLPGSEKPLFEYVGKNVGIRRAKGKYVLATNADLIYNDKLIEFFSSKQLSEDSFYRIDRYDLDTVVPLDLPIEKQLKFCERHVSHVVGADGVYRKKLSNFPKLLHNLTVQYQWDYHKVLYDLKHLLWGLGIKVGEKVSSVYDLHVGCPGDFFLMAKKHWEELNGYPEDMGPVDWHSCFLAYSLGLKQVVLDDYKKIYHQNHSVNRGKVVDRRKIYHLSKKMIKSGEPIIYNEENWGLGHRDLPENKME